MFTINKTIGLMVTLALVISSCSSNRQDKIQNYKVHRGEFFMSVVESGEIKATESMMITAPAISWQFGDLKITKLIDDGKEVQMGDTLVLFDQAEVQKAIIDARAELDIARAEFNKTQADQKSRIDDLKADLKMAEISYEISKLELEQALYESEIKKKEIELQLQQAEISLSKARQEIENQEKINLEELQKLKLKISQLEANLKDAYDTLSKLTVTAPTPGLVIIEKNWMSDNKWQVGDQPWSGWPLMSLPDLSELKVETEINEVDISKIKLDQKVRIKLDASPDTTFTGKVIHIAALAKEKDKKSKVKIFTVEILIDGIHKLLMPGMTASCEIIIDKLDNVLFAPLESVFKNKDKTIVYVLQGGGFKSQEITVGSENNDYVVIESGLKPGDQIALADPTKIVEKNKPEQGKSKK